MSEFDRDFVGYGVDLPSIKWPDGARLALSLVVNYEEGAERSRAFGDDVNEVMGELPRVVSPEHRDLATESVYEYGSRAGIHRLMRLLKTYEIRCTVFAAAVALERNPAFCATIRAHQHEVCGHGWRWSEEWTLDLGEERDRINRAVASIAATCGGRPVGWYSRWMPSEHTRELLVGEGGFLYDSNAYNDDLPYYVSIANRQHLVIPYTLTYNDSRYTWPGFGPTEFVDLCRRGIDELLYEGETHPRLLSIGLHARLSGQAGRSNAVREIIEYALDKGGVWFARRADIARWWLSNYPPSAERV